jgi:uncharacterized damage-inducible protein DinB
MSSRLTDVLDLYAYEDWARRRVLEAASRLTPEQLTRDVGGSFGSVLGTLAHILYADWIWLSRWQGVSPTSWPEEWQIADLRSLAAHWRRVAQDRDVLVAGLREADLDRVVEYRNTRGEEMRSTMSEMLRHVVNHATYHRGQVSDRIRMVGGEPLGTDFIAWYRERPAPVAAAPIRV